MQNTNSWHLSYDLDSKSLETATVTTATIYNRVPTSAKHERSDNVNRMSTLLTPCQLT